MLKKFAVFDDKFLSPIVFQIRQLGQVIQASQAYSVEPPCPVNAAACDGGTSDRLSWSGMKIAMLFLTISRQ